MKDKNKTKAQLLAELAELRQTIANLQSKAAEYEQIENELRDEIATRKLTEVELRRTQKNLQKAEREKALLLDSTQEVFAYYDTELRIQWGNKAAGDSAGVPAQQLVGRHCYEIWHQGSEPCDECHLLRALQTGQPQEAETVTPNDEWWFLRGYPVFNEANEIIGLIELAQNITERKQAEEKLRESEATLKSIFQIAPIGIGLLKDRKVEYANQAFFNMIGYAEEDVIGLSVRMLYASQEEFERVGQEKIAAIKKIGLGIVETQFQRKDGQIIDILLRSCPVDPDNLSAGLVATAMDITARKQAEKALRESLQTSADIVQTIPAGLFIYQFEPPDQLFLLQGNPEAERLTGLHIKDWIGKEFNEIWPKAQEAGITETFLKPMKTGQTFETEELYYEDQRLAGAFKIRAFRLPGDRLAVAFENITEHKQAEAALQAKTEELENFFNYSLDLLCIANTDGYFHRLNQEWEKVLGYRLEELVGQRFLDFVHPDDMEDTLAAVAELDSQKEILNFTNRYRCQNGTYRWIEWRSIPAGKRIYAAARDITKRKQADEKIKASLKEKEVLLKEIHHRVKNNLTVISSLLEFQAEMIDDERVQDAFRTSQNRIYSMARIHEHLYRSDDLVWIDMAEYAQSLAEYLQQAYGAYHFLLKVHTNDVVLEIDKAIPCGLIINELVSNALKHAFPPTCPSATIEEENIKQICILLSPKNETQFVLTVSDNGAGLPTDFDWQNTPSLGLRLVNLLTQQIGGTLELDSNGEGTTFKITFDVKEVQR
jgi:PAS domain S-box-containing protein